MWDYVEATRKMVCDLEHRVRMAKANVESISKIMVGWCQVPLYQRKDDKKDCLLNLDVCETYLQTHTHTHTVGHALCIFASYSSRQRHAR